MQHDALLSWANSLPHVRQFLHFLQYERRASMHTVVSYLTDLHQFDLFITEQGGGYTLVTANAHHIRGWLIQLAQTGLEPRSVSRKQATLRTYFKHLRVTGQIAELPTGRMRSPKLPQRNPTFIPEKDVLKLFENPPAQAFEAIRDRLVLELLYGLGLRLAELISLKLNDVNLIGGTLRVFGKRSKERVVPLHQGLIELIKSYLVFRQSEAIVSEYLLVRSDAGEPLYPVWVQRLVSKELGLVTTVSKRSPHVLRHTFATHLLNEGAELMAIKDILGHANLAATQVYTHNVFEQLKKSYNAAHPKGRKDKSNKADEESE